MVEARLFALIERLGNLFRNQARAFALAHGLVDPVQLAALSYLARANRYSNTVAAVVDYLGLTKGTVSQTVALLERRGLLRKRSDPTDRRVVRLELTPKGLQLARRFHRQLLLNKLGVDGVRLAALETDLEALLRAIQRAHGGRSFGVCQSCRYFQRQGAEFRCGLTGEALSRAQIVRICREHEPPAVAADSLSAAVL